LSGCVDSDGDGVVDIDDRCPTVAGLPTAAGCKDGDGDGIADELDRCPTEPESHDGVDDDDGCPDDKGSKVTLAADRIEIREQVRFETGRATISPDSFSLLDQIATVLRDHAEIAHVSIEGHTDDVGDADKNLALSTGRANAVRDYLVKKGIAAARLKAQGFGKTKPLVKNDSDEHRQQNRRVEFKIVAR
jgi:outer membrane protein OmpA-like peptidoglycan-associated protein